MQVNHANHVICWPHELSQRTCILHRVGRVLSFFSSRRNWDSPTPHTQVSVSPPLLIPGRGTHSLAGEGAGESQFRRGDMHCGTLYIHVLCDVLHLLPPPLPPSKIWVESRPNLHFFVYMFLAWATHPLEFVYCLCLHRYSPDLSYTYRPPPSWFVFLTNWQDFALFIVKGKFYFESVFCIHLFGTSVQRRKIVSLYTWDFSYICFKFINNNLRITVQSTRRVLNWMKFAHNSSNILSLDGMKCYD